MAPSGATVRKINVLANCSPRMVSGCGVSLAIGRSGVMPRIRGPSTVGWVGGFVPHAESATVAVERSTSQG